MYLEGVGVGLIFKGFKFRILWCIKLNITTGRLVTRYDTFRACFYSIAESTCHRVGRQNVQLNTYNVYASTS